MPDKDLKQSAIVVGGGPAGLTAAIALASGGIDTVLAGRRPAASDNRTTALLAGSVTALATLGVWDLCAEQAAPLQVMRIVDDTGRLWRAPEVKFDAEEIGLEAFGHNIENRHLVEALERRARALAQSAADRGRRARHRAGRARGDGSRSRAARRCRPRWSSAPTAAARSAAKPPASAWRRTNIRRSRSPSACATAARITTPRPNFIPPSGPFTLVPLPGNRSSLVWVLDPLDADDLIALDDEELSHARSSAPPIRSSARSRSSRGAGAFRSPAPRARRFARNRIALVGEAAHVIPPIGAQGLNLGLRDAACHRRDRRRSARATAATWAASMRSPQYDSMRRADVGSRTLAVDLLNRTLLTDFLPVQGARGLGLYLLDRIGPLRRALMREGVEPRASQPRLMRGEVL